MTSQEDSSFLNSTVCPAGFVIPQDSGSFQNVYIDKVISDCAISCVDPPTYSSHENHSFLEARLIADIITCGVLVLSVWLTDEIKRKHIFVISSSAVTTVGGFILMVCGLIDDTMFCRNNANPSGGSAGLSLCSIEDAVFAFMVQFQCINFGLQSFGYFHNIVLGRRLIYDPRICAGIIVGIPSICATVGLILNKYGNQLTLGVCEYASDSTASTMLLLPNVLFLFIGVVCCCSVVFKVVMWRGVSVKWVGSVVFFLVFCGCYALSMASLQFASLGENGIREKSAVLWGSCMLAVSTNASTASSDAICGAHPSRVRSFLAQLVYIVWRRAGMGLCCLVGNWVGVVGALTGLCGSGICAVGRQQRQRHRHVFPGEEPTTTSRNTSLEQTEREMQQITNMAYNNELELVV